MSATLRGLMLTLLTAAVGLADTNKDSLGTIQFTFSSEVTGVLSCMWPAEAPLRPRNAQIRLIGPTSLDTVARDYGFALKSLRPGDYLIIVKLAPYLPETLLRYVPPGGKINAHSRLRPRGSRTVFGRVSDRASGQPLHLAGVYLTGTSALAPTDRQGDYRIPDVPRGYRWMQVTKSGYLPDSAGFCVAGGHSLKVDFVLIDTFRPRSAVLTVLDATTGQAVAGADVSVDGDRIQATTDSQGTCRLDQVPWQPVDVRVSAPGFQTTSVVPGQLLAETTRLSIPVCPAGWSGLCGIVLDRKSSQRLSGTSINVLAGDSIVADCASIRNGIFALPNLKPGSYRARFSLIGFRDAWADIAVSEDAATTILVRLEPQHI